MNRLSKLLLFAVLTGAASLTITTPASAQSCKADPMACFNKLTRKPPAARPSDSQANGRQIAQYRYPQPNQRVCCLFRNGRRRATTRNYCRETGGRALNIRLCVHQLTRVCCIYPSGQRRITSIGLCRGVRGRPVNVRYCTSAR
jgi:hypothetical protein